MNVKELQGNAPLKEQLSAMAEPPHQCILSGPEGSGRHTLAQILAQALVCQEPQRCAVLWSVYQLPKGCPGDSPGCPPHPAVLAAGEQGDQSGRRPSAPAGRLCATQRGAMQGVSLGLALKRQCPERPVEAAGGWPGLVRLLILTDQPASLLETVRSRCVHFRLTPPHEEAQAETSLGEAWLNALCANSELALVECVAKFVADKVTRDQLEESYQVLSQRLVEELIHPNPKLTIPRAKLVALTKLAEEARNQCAFNPSVGHSAGWFAARSWQILMGSGAQNHHP